MTDENAANAGHEFSLYQLLAIEKIFLPNLAEKRSSWGDRRVKFAHYTSAEAALKIIRSKTLWMRSASCMSDYKELEHGFELISPYLTGGERCSKLCDALDKISPDLCREAIDQFTSNWQHFRRTYIGCLSEHHEAEDAHGRLSMWRAFGGASPRVAIVINVKPFNTRPAPHATGFVPAAYWTQDRLHAEMDVVCENVKQNSRFLGSLSRVELARAILYMFISASVSLKHEGFREEQEWRLVHNPELNSSPLVRSSVESLGGTPQLVYKFPLDWVLSPDFSHLDFVTLFDKIIVGPTTFCGAIRDALVVELKAAGIVNPEERVIISGIPIRD